MKVTIPISSLEPFGAPGFMGTMAEYYVVSRLTDLAKALDELPPYVRKKEIRSMDPVLQHVLAHVQWTTR